METHREPEDVRLPAGQVLVPLMGGGRSHERVALRMWGVTACLLGGA